MSDLGIPIPRVKPNGVFCAGCGETGMHADTCPSLHPVPLSTAVELAELRARLARLESQFFDMATNAEGRLLALEAKRKK